MSIEDQLLLVSWNFDEDTILHEEVRGLKFVNLFEWAIIWSSVVDINIVFWATLESTEKNQGTTVDLHGTQIEDFLRNFKIE